jgi:1-acyl-sn-glycerol-3-phosphate acyltransferase
MAAKPPRRKSSGKRSKGRSRKHPARPVLGNDPFERGAAVRGAAPLASIGPSNEGAAAHSPSPSAPEAQAPTIPAPEATAASAVTSAAASLRSRLGALESQVDSAALRLESAAARAAGKLGDLARQEASGQQARDLGQALAGVLPALRERLTGISSLRALFGGPGTLDAYGMDRDLIRNVMPLLEFLYASWWRVETRQLDQVPADGPVILVANHGGTLPWDALALRVALLRDHPAHRELRPLLDDHALKLPLVGTAAQRLGAVPATPDNALKLLREGQALAVFPEGSRNARRPWPQRYRVERFGRGGFAKLALRAGAPIIPCAIVGSEETSAPFARPGWLADALGLPSLTSVPSLPLSALGAFPLPSRWSIRFGEPISTSAAGAAAAEEQGHVLELTERARAALQQMLDEDVAARRSVYL